MLALRPDRLERYAEYWAQRPRPGRLWRYIEYWGRAAALVAVSQYNACGVLHLVRQDYELAVLCALTFNIAGQGAVLDVFLLVALSATERQPRLWLFLREAYIAYACSFCPLYLRVELLKVAQEQAVPWRGLPPVALDHAGAFALLWAMGRVPWFLAPALMALRPVPALLLGALWLCYSMVGINPLTWLGVPLVLLAAAWLMLNVRVGEGLAVYVCAKLLGDEEPPDLAAAVACVLGSFLCWLWQTRPDWMAWVSHFFF
jgi:hypothetical protein